MLTQATPAERFAFGRPLDPTEDLAVHVAPRPTWMLLGRVFLAAIFLSAGFGKLAHTAQTAEFMTAQGIPGAYALAIIAGLAEVLGGLAILTGFLTRVAALGLILFLIPTIYFFHDFWTMEGAARQAEVLNFLKALAVMGGLAMLVACGAGRYSIDARLRRPIEA